MRHKLDLLENATDSLNEGLRQYLIGAGGYQRAYKFAVLHFAQALELLFKYQVSLAHPLLIYRDPFSDKVKKGTASTIGLWDAVQFLNNDGKPISADLKKDLEWLKKLRNDIEHYSFEMDVREVRRTLGRLIRATNEFNEELGQMVLSDHIHPDCQEAFETLADEYTEQRANARLEAVEDSDNDPEDCPNCGENGTVAINGLNYKCKLCGSSGTKVMCCHCENHFQEEQVSVWNDDHAPSVDYICDDCEDYLMSRD